MIIVMHTFVKGTIKVAANTAATPNRNNKQAIYKNCSPFTPCTSAINKTLVEYAKDFKVVMKQKKLEVYGNIKEINQII